MDIPAVEKVSYVSIYPMLQFMDFDTDISDEVAKIRSTTLLGEILHLHQRTENTLKYVHTNLKNGNLVAIPCYETRE